MNFRRKLLVPCLMLFLLSIPVSGSAKSIWLEPSSGSEFRLEGIKPEFKDSELSTFSMVWFLSGYLEATDKLHLNVEIPYARFAGADGGESSKSIGNPYLGLDVGSLDSGSMIEFGFRLPMSSDEEIATLLGAYTDYVDRFEAFFPDVLSVIAAANYRTRSPSGFGLRLRLSPILWIDTGDMLTDTSEVWIRYSAQTLFTSGPSSIGIGFSGRYLAMEDNTDDFGEKSWHEIGIFANWDLGTWKPSARIRLPLDEDLKDLYDAGFVLGIGIGRN